MTNTFFHRALALALVLIMLFSLPSAALAAEGEPGSADSGENGGSTESGGNESGGGNEGGGTETTPALTGVTVTFSEHIQLTMGSAVTLDDTQVKYGYKPEGADKEDVRYHWSFTDSSAGDYVSLSNVDSPYPTLTPLKVTNDGLSLQVEVEYTANGETKTATAIAQYAVKVGYAQPKSISLSNRILERDKGADPVVLTATQLAETADGGTAAGLCDDSKLSWRSSDPDVADVVEKTGTATTHISFKKPGTATITVTAKGANGKDVTATCFVTVMGILVKYGEDDITDGRIEIPVGKEIDLEVQAIGDKFIGTYAFWESGSQAAYVDATKGHVTAQAVGSTQIKVTQAGYVAYCTINVVENTVGIIDTSIGGDQTLALDSLLTDLNKAYREAMNNAGITGSSASGLSYLTNLSVPAEQGVLYYNYVSPDNHGYGVGGSEEYHVSPGVGGRGLSGVTFVPNQGFSGKAVINYSGYDSNRNSFVGTIRVEVTASKGVNYVTQINTPVNFMMDDFNDVHLGVSGRDVRYVTFELPNPNQGTLYYDYLGTGEYTTLVTAGDRFSRINSPYLDRVRFVPAQGFAGLVRIVYHVTDTSYAVSTGYVSIRVNNLGGISTQIKYVTQQGEEQPFHVADFIELCREVLDGESLDYLYFTLPDSSLGTLWYHYNNNSGRSRVTASTRYYRNNSSTRPGVGGVYFEPGDDTVGLVSIPFTVYSTAGNRFRGTVSIQYNGVGEGELNFRIRASETVIFNAADFNEVCVDATGSSFDYVRFNRLPSASTQGSLYSNYYSASSTGSRITNINSSYNRTGSLSRVAFIPVISFSGTVSIPFTAYKSDGSRVFAGTVNIEVESIGDFTVRYDTYSGREVQFDGESFAVACQRVTGYSLNYVRFEQPSSARGKLYYNYSTGKTNNTAVNSSTSYYQSGSYSRKISDVTFVPDSNFTGTLTFNYTGVASNNARYTGKIEIQVSAAVAQVINDTGTSLPKAMDAAAFYRACSQVLPRGLSYIEFTSLPTASQGVMYWNYAPPDPGTRVTTGTRYYYNGMPGISWLTFVPKAEYSGTVSIDYRAYDSTGLSATGTMNLFILSGSTACHFRDMAAYTWAAPSTEFLYQSGIVQGTNMERMEYSPAERITRGQFTTMLCRAFGLETEHTVSFPDVPANEYYTRAVATAKELGIVTGGADGLFHAEEALPRQEAMLMLYRTMGVAGYQLPSAGANLSLYPDGWQVGQEYRSAVSVMIQMGVMRGDGSGRLLPEDTLSRAEMAVVMHRAMTMQRS